ncbi:MAG: hypothetical protein JXA54_11080 [Candidatus Heimdallarchaeota archaeon]|nr:hypothetical protein [Candidatus Heimdallarchaeota archaeon]
MGKGGLDLYKIYPERLAENIMNEVVIKSMPMGAKEGDFTTVSISDGKVFSGYIFSVPFQIGRDNIVSLIAIFDNLNYHVEVIEKNFKLIVNTLKDQNIISLELISELLPQINECFIKTKGFVKINNDLKIPVNFTSLPLNTKDKLKDFTEDIWGKKS